MQDTENIMESTYSVQLAMIRGKFSKAVAKCDRVLKSYPDCSDFLRLKGAALLNISNRLEEGRDIFQKLIANGSQESDDHCSLAYSYYLSGNYQKALAGFKKALKADKTNFTALFYMASTLAKLERVNEAIKLLETNIKPYRKKHPEFAADLLATSVSFKRKYLKQQDLRPIAIKAVKLCTFSGKALYELRKLNPLVNMRKTKQYYIDVEGKTNVFSFRSRKQCEFMGSYEVLANTKKEALEYIKEVQVYADPNTIEITKCKKLKLDKKEKNCGVLVIHPSMSYDVQEVDLPINIRDYSSFLN